MSDKPDSCGQETFERGKKALLRHFCSLRYFLPTQSKQFVVSAQEALIVRSGTRGTLVSDFDCVS